MIEREAQVPGDRALVAAVIYNRLRAGMPLGIDATLRYSLNDYTHPLTESQLALDTPYNTRLHRGLPPTPIANPGLASMIAAAHPAHVSYLYYVDKPYTCGELAFATTATRSSWPTRTPTTPRARTARAGTSPERRAREPRPPRRARLAGRATAARRRCSGPRSPRSGCAGWSYQLLPVPPELFEETVRALPGVGLRRRERDGPAQARGARARRQRRRAARARSAPRTR